MKTESKLSFSSFLDNFGWRKSREKCEHKNVKKVFENFQDRRTHYRCNDCNSYLTEDWPD